MAAQLNLQAIPVFLSAQEAKDVGGLRLPYTRVKHNLKGVARCPTAADPDALCEALIFQRCFF